MAEKNLIVAPGVWSPRVAELLAAAMLADPGADLNDLRAAVESGAATLLHVLSQEGGELLGVVVLRIEERRECVKFGAYRDGVIVAAGASERWAWRALPALLANLEGRFFGVQRIRIHTASRALLRALVRQGYRLQEFVLWKPATTG